MNGFKYDTKKVELLTLEINVMEAKYLDVNLSKLEL